MSRAKRGFKARQRRKKVLQRASGFRGSRNNRFTTAIHVTRRAMQFAYRDRRVRKREFRGLWILRINAAAREEGLSYSRLIDGLNKANIDIDRKVLAELAVSDKNAFARLADQARSCLVS